MSRRFSIIGSGTTALTDSGSALTSTEPILLPAGTVGSPALAFSAETNTGIYRRGAGALTFALGGAATPLELQSNLAILPSAGGLIWLSAGIGAGSIDTAISRQAAGVIQIGTANGNASGNLQLAKITSYNGTATAGNGVSAVVGVTSQKSETGADAAVLSFTPPAAVGTYRVSIAWSVTTATTAIIGWTATWKDSGGTAQAPTNLSLFQVGTAAPALTFTAATGSAYYATAQFDIDNSATAIVIKTTMGTGTLTASKLTATIERIN